ncbi:MAG: tRNA epoxyqueuosine(34) reductase QueG [Saprospiraceae bacterium]|jgi:epoxyqueuosine reductase|nr:tRNA epoxyqueuosine(34) reductase QueG [Saprospiraceae bacterium]MDP4997415.1 tRNA epoxyqueuosine(34) reductase QueG [Saprospiraceae bacterium]
MDLKERTHWLKSAAATLGFAFVGISKAESLDEEARYLEKWLAAGHQGNMGYMERNFDKRIDPRKLVPGARSVISLMYNYYTPDKPADPDAPKMATYAYGADYHHVIKAKLRTLMAGLQEQTGAFEGRCFVDSAPVMERDWAKRSGLGWMGKNTLLIHPRAGSFFFLAEIILDLDFEYDGPIKDYCGTCRRCIEACPTGAIAPGGYQLDASKCISYFTIEYREELIPDAFQGQFENWMFGCDICQDVCPWNRFSTRHQEPEFEPKAELLQLRQSDWIELTEEIFGRLFRHTAVERTGFKGLQRNIRFLQLPAPEATKE